MAARFLRSSFQINQDAGVGQGIVGSQQLPDVTTLADGRFEVVYQSDYNGVSSDPDPIEAVFTADGNVSSPSYRDVYSADSAQITPAIAARPGGGSGIVFTNERHADQSVDTRGTNITYRPVAADGTPGVALAIGEFDFGLGHDTLLHPAIATMSGGQQVVAFERIFSATDHDIFLNVVSVDGVVTTFSPADPLEVADTVAFEADPAVAAIGEKAVVAYEFSGSSTDIVARIFDGTTNTIGNQFLIADHAASLADAKIATLDDHRVVIVYTDTHDVFARIYDASNGALSQEITIGRSGLDDLQPDVAVTLDGGFIVTWAGSNGVQPEIRAQRFNSDGVAMGGSFVVSEPVAGDKNHPSVSISGVTALFAWSDFGVFPSDQDPFSVRGQVMSLTTQPDFNDNGISDILWRNDNGMLAAWDMSRSGAIAGSGEPTFNGVAVRPDASWSIAGISDFTGDGRADVLWRDAGGPLAIWAMHGSVIGASDAIKDSAGNPVQPDASWSVAGTGDFNFDGRSDILWRDSSGSLAVWSMDGSKISSSGLVTSGGKAVSLDASWNVAGIGDFNGDGKADVIWRNTSGEVAEWQMNGAAIAVSGDLNAAGSAVRPDASWSVAGVGDFNADGKSDLLWRNSNGSLVEWLMDGTSIASSGVVTSGGKPVSPDASWHVVEIGDFNLDARTDILWRNDNGALAEWMMNGSRIVSSTTPSFNGAVDAPDAGWHTQAKPTNFA